MQAASNYHSIFHLKNISLYFSNHVYNIFYNLLLLLPAIYCITVSHAKFSHSKVSLAHLLWMQATFSTRIHLHCSLAPRGVFSAWHESSEHDAITAHLQTHMTVRPDSGAAVAPQSNAAHPYLTSGDADRGEWVDIWMHPHHLPLKVHLSSSPSVLSIVEGWAKKKKHVGVNRRVTANMSQIET